MTKNLTSGNPLKLIFNFSIPILIGNLIQQFYSMIDSIFIGKFVSLNAFAGVSASSFLIFLIFGFVFGISNGCSIVLARRFGAKSKTGVKLCITSSIYILAIVTIIVTALSVLATSQVLKILNTPEDIMPFAKTYALVNFYGIFACMSYNMFSQMLRALGDNKAALIFLIISSLLNVILDYFSVVILNLSVAGAAISTIVSQALSAIGCILYMFKRYSFTRPSKIYWRFNKTFFFAQLKLGIPIALETSICAVGLVVLQKAINSLGSAVVSGFAIAMKVEDLLLVTFFAISTAASIFTAQNFGAERFYRIKKGTKAALLLGFLSCLLFGIIFITSWDFFVQLFISQSKNLEISHIAEVKLAARKYINIVLFHYPVLSTLIIMRNIVQSLGKTFVPLCGGFAELVARIFGAFILGNFFGYDGMCFSTILAWWLACVPMIFSYFNNIKKLLKDPKNFKEPVDSVSKENITNT